jgi:AraC-like DNA-binding protein
LLYLANLFCMDPFKHINSELEKHSESIYVGRDLVESQLPLHEHPRSQMLIVENGIGHLKTNLSTYFIPSKHYIWIPKGFEHRVEFKPGKLIIKTIYFNDEQDLLHPFYGRVGIYTLGALLKEMLYYTHEWLGLISGESLRYEFLLTIKHLLPQISNTPLKIELPHTSDKRLASLLEFLALHLEQNLSLSFLAEKFGYSVRNLTRIFDKELQVSYMQYLKTLRAIHAMELLTNGKKNVTEAAYLVGYTSLTAFSNSFKEIVSIRPQEFKQLFQKV